MTESGRFGPNSPAVEAVISRARRLTAKEIAAAPVVWWVDVLAAWEACRGAAWASGRKAI